MLMQVSKSFPTALIHHHQCQESLLPVYRHWSDPGVSIGDEMSPIALCFHHRSQVAYRRKRYAYVHAATRLLPLTSVVLQL
jgi:hypothetical protein